ncbi:hypothetical protein BEV13_03180, partial [Rickettsiella grylli]
ELTTQIQNCGGFVVHFPTLEINQVPNIKKINSELKKLNHYHFVIFISPNSVFNTAPSIHAIWPHWPCSTKTIATGLGTVSALKQHHLPSHFHPEKNYTGMGIINLSILQTIKGKKILIIKGQGGRLNLIKNLKTRGASVNNLVVYKRQLPAIEKQCIPNQEDIDVIICTSGTGLKNLVTLLHPRWESHLFKKQMLVISPRLAVIAKKLGFVKLPLIADNASHDAILHTLFSWQEQPIWKHNPI